MAKFLLYILFIISTCLPWQGQKVFALSPKTSIGKMNESQQKLIKRYILESPEILTFFDRWILDLERGVAINRDEMLKLCFNLLKKDRAAMIDNSFYPVIIKLINHFFNGSFHGADLKNALKNYYPRLTRYQTDFVRLFVIHKEMGRCLDLSDEEYDNYDNVPELTIKTQDFSYYWNLSLKERFLNISRFSLRKRHQLIPELIKFVYEEEIKNGFIPEIALNISESRFNDVTVELNESMFLKILLGPPDQGEVIKYEQLKRKISGFLSTNDEVREALAHLYVTEGKVKKRSSAFLDFSRLPSHEIGILYMSHSKKPMMFLPNPYPYFKKESKHMVLSSASKVPQSIKTDIIKDIFVLLQSRPFKGYYAGYNGNGQGSGATIEERQHFQIYEKRLPINSLNSSAADVLITLPDKTKIGVFEQNDIMQMPSIIIESYDLDSISRNTFDFLSYLDEKTILYNLHWNIEQYRGKNIFKMHMVLINQKTKGHEVFGRGRGVTFTGGVFLLQSPIMMLKREIKGMYLNTPNMVKAASRIFCGMVSPLYGNLAQNTPQKSSEVLRSKIEEDFSKTHFWDPYFELKSEEKIAVLKYLISLVHVLLEKGFNAEKISKGLSIQDYRASRLIDPNFIENVKECFRLSCHSFDFTKNAVFQYINQKIPLLGESDIKFINYGELLKMRKSA